MNNGKIYSKYDFGDILKKRRKACGYRSCSKLAEAMLPPAENYKDTTPDLYAKNVETLRKKIERWEAGTSEPSVSEFKQLCDLLACDPEHLWGTCEPPRRETKKVMDITGLDESVVGYLIRIQKEDKDSLRVLNRLLNCEGIDHLLYLLNFCSYCISELEDEIDRAEKYARKELDPYTVADEDYVGERWWSIPSGVDDEYANLRRWRFEISHHFSNLVDDLFEIEKIDKAVADISKRYNTPRVGKNLIENA